MTVTVGLAVASSAVGGTTLALAAVVSGGGVLAVRGGTVDIAVLAPSLSTVLIVVLVVPFVVGLSGVSLSSGVVVSDGLLEVLIATPSIEVGSGLAPVASGTSSGGGVDATLLAVALATVSTVVGGSGLAVGVTGLLVVSVVVLSPLVVIGPHGALIPLVVVALGINGVVRLAPSGVGVLSVSLLGPLVVVVATLGGAVLSGGISHLLVAVALALGTSVAVRVLVGVAVAGLATVAVSVVGVLGGGLAVGGFSVSIAVLAPSLSAVHVVVGVVPFVVRLSGVGLGVGLAVTLIDGEVLISAPGIEVGAPLSAVVGLLGSGSGLDGSSLAVRDLWLVGVAGLVAPLELNGLSHCDESSGESE